MSKSEVREGLAKLWGHFMREGQFNNAMQIGSIMHSEGTRTNNSLLMQEGIGMLRSSVKELSPETEKETIQKECSFCGQKPPKVKLGAGPTAFICNECVSRFNIIFSKPEI